MTEPYEALDDLAVLPAQFRQAGVATTPARRLWLAVIEDATRRLYGSSPRLASEAREWFSSPSEAIGSFRWIILSWGWDADAWQQRMARGITNARPRARMRGRA